MRFPAFASKLLAVSGLVLLSSSPVVWGVPLAAIARADVLAIEPATKGSTYRRPRNHKPPRTGGSTGRRGSSQANTTVPMPVILAPRHHVGQTTRPVLTWYVQPTLADLRQDLFLYVYNPDTDAFEEIYSDLSLPVALSGYQTFTVPIEDIEPGYAIEADKIYKWEISVRPANSGIAVHTDEAQFEVVTPSADLSAQLAEATTPTETASLYASEGLWYDAIALVATDPTATQLRDSLISDLLLIEQEEFETLAQNLSDLQQQAEADPDAVSADALTAVERATSGQALLIEQLEALVN